MAVVDDDDKQVAVLLGNGDGTLQDAVYYDVGPGSITLYGADLDLDGNLDLVECNEANDTIGVLRGLGNGKFAPTQYFGAGDGPRAAAIGDYNGDGKLDIAVTDDNSNQVSVLINTSQ